MERTQSLGKRIACAHFLFVFGMIVCTNLQSLTPDVDLIYTNIAKGRSLTVDKTYATFFDGENSWSIFGAGQEKAAAHTRSEHWSVGNSVYKLSVVNKPISNDHILPYSDPVPNISDALKISISAARGEYEPASFVIRSGDKSLENVVIEVPSLISSDGERIIQPENIDIRIVKVWFQSGLHVARRADDKKRLVPELLLHDASLVDVDLEHQVNLVRNIEDLQDSNTLLPFDVPSRANQQIWVLVYVPTDAKAGDYKGVLNIGFNSGSKFHKASLDFNLQVLPIDLVPSPAESVLFYLAWPKPVGWKGLDARGRSPVQMEAELKDMRMHGLTNVAVDHHYDPLLGGSEVISNFEPVLPMLRRAGFDTTDLLYVDWKVTGKSNSEAYREKISSLQKIGFKYGFDNLYVYNQDETDLETLLANRSSFEIVHELGAKNFVTTRPEYASGLSGLVDVGISQRRWSPDSLRINGMVPWSYNSPQAGEETPETYRINYGVSMWLDGYDGVCNFAYQTANLAWNDWENERWRPHNMAYPTVTKPVSTLQWEGWREGVDDLRYMATLINIKTQKKVEGIVDSRSSYLANALSAPIPEDPSLLRASIVGKLLDLERSKPPADSPPSPPLMLQAF